MSLAVIFNGQGAHYKGMGQDFSQNFKSAQSIYEKVEKISDYPIRKWIEEDASVLSQTQYAQVAISATSLAIYASIKDKLPPITFMAGLSLGEYSALIASGALPFEQGFELIKSRGQLMTSHCDILKKHSDIAMEAVMKVPLNDIERLVAEVNVSEEELYIANINSSSQVVIAGTTSAIEDYRKLSKERGFKRTMPLKVEGPFHTPYMAEVGEPFAEVLSQVDFQDSDIPVVSNITVEPHDKETVEKLLVRHLVEPVRWKETIDYLVNQGVTQIIQIGPGKTLANLLKREANAPETIVIDKISDLEKLENLKGG